MNNLSSHARPKYNTQKNSNSTPQAHHTSELQSQYQTMAEKDVMANYDYFKHWLYDFHPLFLE
jgi:hypothetical protein